MALPAEIGPTWGTDQLSVWPLEGGRFGSDVHYEGTTGGQRAAYQADKLAKLNLRAKVRENPLGDATLRLGALDHRAACGGLAAFPGRPLPPDAGPVTITTALAGEPLVRFPPHAQGPRARQLGRRLDERTHTGAVAWDEKR